jgi:molybdopterin molybdotransferase
MNNKFIGYQKALDLTFAHIKSLEVEERSLMESADYVAADDIYALVDSPSVYTSLKDGYAIRSEEITDATLKNPIRLKLLGLAAAGASNRNVIQPATTIRILTGAQVPEGADAVVSEEFTRTSGEYVTVNNYTKPGQNILPKGCDVGTGDLIISKGSSLSPGKIGILAAAGHNSIAVVRKPQVAIIATGDEVLMPGQQMSQGKLYASNLLTLNAWCSRYGMKTSLNIVGDDAQVIKEKLKRAVETHDAVLTSGGAWTGDRDLVVRMLKELGWQEIYHRVRIGPGKAIGFGILNQKPIFVLPGGPPSNLLAFLKLALPGLLKLAGDQNPQLPYKLARLTETVKGQSHWTQFIFGRFEYKNGIDGFCPIKKASRLQSIAEAEGIITIPEGVDHISAGSDISATLLV